MEQIFGVLNKLNSAQRAFIIGGFSLLFVLLIALLIYSNMKSQDEKLNYLIASNLTKNQVMLATNELEAAEIPFSILGSGDRLSIKTNKNNVNVAKIKLLVSQSVTSKHSGWEIFDKSSLGTTNFENKVKYKRALEGELARSLESLNGILSAKVKIGQPKDTIFTQRKLRTKASAMLRLREGSSLSRKQITGIKNFIASAVTNLKPQDIKLINQDGSLLELSVEDIDNTKYLVQDKYKKGLEEGYEQKIIDILEPFIGANRVVAKVSVTLSFTKKDITEEIFNPEGTIRSQQTTEITSANEEKKNKTGGTAGVVNNIENPDNASGGANAKSSREEAKNIINYEISNKVIKQQDSSYASIGKITAGISFDSTVLEGQTDKKAFLLNMNAIVQEAIGFDKKRGDKVSIKPFKFLKNAKSKGIDDKKEEDTSDMANDMNSMFIKSIMQDFGEYIQYIISIILLFIFYKNFISKNDIIMPSDSLSKDGKGGASGGASGGIGSDDIAEEDYSFNSSVAKNRLKAKIKSEIFNNLDGLDEESAVKYEVLIEELDREVHSKPEDIASMIEMLLFESNEK